MIRTSITALLLAAALSACGGGGGGSSEDPVATAPPQPTGNTLTGAAAIEVPEGFEFDTSKVLPFEVSLGSGAPARSYLTVCRPKASGPDYEACLLRAPVSGGVLSGSLDVPNDIEHLVFTVWSFQPAEVVQTASWQRGNDDFTVFQITD